MFDIHNHLIYKFDDGPKSLDESLDMLRMAQDQGITDVFATSHFNEIIPAEVENQYFEKLKILRNEAAGKNIAVHIHSGAELFYHIFMDETIKQHRVATLAGLGQYVLMEFSLFIMATGVEDVIFKLSMENIIPIIAHPARYPAIRENPEKSLDYIRYGALFQLNVGSILGDFGKDVQKVSMWMLEKRIVQFLGSDAHTTKGKRIFKLREAIDFLRGHLDEDYIQELVYENPQKILNSQKIDKLELSELFTLKDGFLSKLKRRFGLSAKVPSPHI